MKILDIIYNNNLDELKTLIADGLDVNENFMFSWNDVASFELKYDHMTSEEFDSLKDMIGDELWYEILEKCSLLSIVVGIGAEYDIDVFNMASFLIEEGADLSDSYNLLISALESPVLVDLLLTAGVDPNAQDEYGDTALHDAIMYEVVETVELLANVTDLTIANNYGQTPLSLAYGQEIFSDIFSSYYDSYYIDDASLASSDYEHNDNNELLLLTETSSFDI